MDEQIKARLETFYKKKGLRKTSQRDQIVDHIFASDEHFSPEQLFDRLRAAGARPSRATRERTLALLHEAGLLQEIDLGDGQTTYDPNFHIRPSHNHLVCLDCGKVTEFQDDHLDLLNSCIARRLGFRPEKNSLRIEATCDRLRAKGNCPELLQARLSGKRLPNRKK